MKRKPPVNHETAQEAVQDYLDLMLKPVASAQNGPGVNPLCEHEHTPETSQHNQPAALTMVTGPTLPVSASSRHKRHNDPPALPSFAEPVKPLTLKMPLPAIKSDTTTEAKAQAHDPSIQAKTTTPTQPLQKADSHSDISRTTPATQRDVTKVAPAIQRDIAEATPTIPGNATKTTAVIQNDTTKVTPASHAAEAASAIQRDTTQAVLATQRDTTETAPAIQTDQPDSQIAITGSIQPSPWLENGRPVWAQQRFECLLFAVGGLTLAVPLVELGTIYPLNDELTPIFGQAEWFLGLLSTNRCNIRTVNTAKIVMPERYHPSMAEQFSYVITINNVDWGLAVDSVSSAITLEPDDIRWRGERSKRPWLAGTVVDKMCALLDVSQLAAMFIEQDKPTDRTSPQ